MEFIVSIDIKGKPVAVGSISGESSADARFTYAADYLNAPEAVAISFSLPLQPEPFTAHQLRHSYATMLYDADVDVKTAQKLLGHADFSVTMKIYTNLSTEKERAGIEKLNQHVTEHLGNRIEVLANER